MDRHVYPTISLMGMMSSSDLCLPESIVDEERTPNVQTPDMVPKQDRSLPSDVDSLHHHHRHHGVSASMSTEALSPDCQSGVYTYASSQYQSQTYPDDSHDTMENANPTTTTTSQDVERTTTARDEPKSPALKAQHHSQNPDSRSPEPVSERTVNEKSNVVDPLPVEYTLPPSHGHSSHTNNHHIVDWDTPYGSAMTTDEKVTVFRDPSRPSNWPLWKKTVFTTTAMAMLLAVSFASSIFIPFAPSSSSPSPLTTMFSTNQTVLNLSVSLFLLGLCFGPIIFGPLSSSSSPSSDSSVGHKGAGYGHRLPLALSLLGTAVFHVPTALAQNIETVLITRFIAGVFAGGVVVVVPRMMMEVYPGITAWGLLTGVEGCCLLLGASVGPVAGAHLVQDGNWRWAGWTVVIITACLFVLGSLLGATPETSSAVLLRRKAQRMRVETGNWALHARCEEDELADNTTWRAAVARFVREYVVKPARMMVSEPVLLLVSLGVAVVYGTLYLVLQGVVYAFIQGRGWTEGQASLPLISVALGILIGVGLYGLFTMTWHKRRFLSRGHGGGVSDVVGGGKERQVKPEDRVPALLAGSVVLPPSLFWFAWSMETHAASQVVAAFFVGMGITLVFVAGVAYLWDAYGSSSPHVDAAMAAHVVVRSLLAASFPLWTPHMYAGLGVQWATSVMAFVCVGVLIPLSVVLLVFGPRLRSRGTFSFVS